MVKLFAAKLTQKRFSISQMKRYIFLLFSTFCSIANAQQRYGNEWIDYSRSYLKMAVSEDGFYRISLTDIQKAGIDTQQPERLQVYFRGQELAIKQTDSYLEFYGLRNNGAQDSLLYRPYNARANSYQTLYSDISYYFLTTGSTNGKRVTKTAIGSTSNLLPIKYHLEEKIAIFNTEYSFNNYPGPVPNLQQSYYENGEGWTGGMIRRDSLAVWNIQLENLLTGNGFPKPQLSFQINGRSDYSHQPQAFLNSTALTQFNFYGYKFQNYTTEIEAASQFTLKLQSKLKDDYEIYSLSYYKVIYPQSFTMNNTGSKVFNIVGNAQTKSLVKVENVAPNTSVYDMTDIQNIIEIESQNVGSSLQFVVLNNATQRKIWLTNTAPKTISNFTKISFEKINPSLNDYLIITHQSLWAGAQAFATYRASKVGGEYIPKVIDVQPLYDQFGYGEHHPIAIRRYADYMLSGGKIPYLFLIGRPYTFPDFLRNNPDDLVPSIGYPGSDILLTAGLNNMHQDVPALPTGRLNVTTNEQILVYLNKVKEFENEATNGLWRKNVLHLSGGKSVSEIDNLRTTLKNIESTVNQQFIGGRVSAVAKKSPVEVENVNVSKQVNEGLGMMTFFGHSSPTITDLNIGFASTAGNGLENAGKYPLMYFVGCAIGNVFFRYNTMPSDWLLTPNKGAIAVVAPSYWSFFTSSSQHLQTFYNLLYANKPTFGLPIGKIHHEVNKQLSSRSDSDEYLRSNLHQSVLQGDPALVIYPLKKPDYQLSDKGLIVQSKNGISPISKADSVQVGVVVSNLGLFDKQQKFTLKATLISTDNSTVSKQVALPSVAYQDTIFITLKRSDNLKKIIVLADPDQQIDELNENNNAASLDIDWAKVAAQTVYPAALYPDVLPPLLSVSFDKKNIKNGAVVAQNPLIDIDLRDDNALFVNDTLGVEIFFKKCEKCSFEKIPSKSLSFTSSQINMLSFRYLPSLKPEKYTLLVVGRDAAKNYSIPYQISFSVVGITKPSAFVVYPNPAPGFVVFKIDVSAAAPPTIAKLQLFNLNGQLVFEKTESMGVGENRIIVEPTSLQTGDYIYKVITEWPDFQEVATGKITILR